MYSMALDNSWLVMNEEEMYDVNGGAWSWSTFGQWTGTAAVTGGTGGLVAGGTIGATAGMAAGGVGAIPGGLAGAGIGAGIGFVGGAVVGAVGYSLFGWW